MLFPIDILKIILYIIMGGFGLVSIYILGKTLFHTFTKLEDERKYIFAKTIFVVTSILIFISLVSYNENDYLQTTILQLKLQPNVLNKAGFVGAIVSFLLFRIFGIAGYLIPLILLFFGVIPRRHTHTLLLQSCFLLGIGIFVIFLISLIGLEKEGVIGKNLSIFLGFEGGGIIGKSLSAFFVKYLGKIGAYIISFVFLFLLVWSKITKPLAVANVVRQFLKFFKRVPRTEDRKPKVEREKKTIVKEHIENLEALTPETKPIPVPHPFDVSEFNKLYLDILKTPTKQKKLENEKEIEEGKVALKGKFEEFGIKGDIVGVSPGPVVTRYEFAPAPGIKLSRISALSDDISLSMKSPKIRIVAPIPGKSVVGIEVPNKERENVYLKEILTSPSFEKISSKLGIALGKDIAGEPVCEDITHFPHLLIAGATGSGKSVCINSMIASILYRALPEEVKFVMIDPKRIELPVYNGIPHLAMPVISDAKDSLKALKSAISWMEVRYKEFAKAGVRDIEGYNAKMRDKKAYILIIIDELADLMITAPREIEEILTRLASMSRAVGIHLILATQRPSVDIITGLIKANFPARLAFQVASKTDSRTILDMNGAEKLLGRGDMLFIPPGKGAPVRLHGGYISTEEAKSISKLWAKRYLTERFKDKIPNASLVASSVVEEDMIDPLIFKYEIPGGKERIEAFAEKFAKEYAINKDKLIDFFYEFEYYPPMEEVEKVEQEVYNKATSEQTEDLDELFEQTKELVIRHQVASVSLLQRHFKIGYARAGRIIDQLEKAGVIGPYVGSKSRQVLIPREQK